MGLLRPATWWKKVKAWRWAWSRVGAAPLAWSSMKNLAMSAVLGGYGGEPDAKAHLAQEASLPPCRARVPSP